MKDAARRLVDQTVQQLLKAGFTAEPIHKIGDPAEEIMKSSCQTAYGYDRDGRQRSERHRSDSAWKRIDAGGAVCGLPRARGSIMEDRRGAHRMSAFTEGLEKAGDTLRYGPRIIVF